ncbi:hypothetical protein J4E83_010288 [Alternaria metachromatica]|uniref:uncharacterized protein n=1 Tax=Alternaria metachromatica TaxID=283354 RepID=UPI0020C25E34|nr:uncharacterized protein J4E83_010288 [Alternaria metachromatica]KAI4606021.1 hypothetical protein J4E83_010288 [Alternaria metachromatica]
MDPKDAIIQLIVPNCAGDTERLQVHRGVLCKSSEFFRRAMKPEWTDRNDDPKTLDLPEDSATIVSDYIKWLYQGEIPIRLHIADGVTREERCEEAEEFFVQIARAYVFGERMIDVKYKNALFKALFTAQDKFSVCMGAESIRIIYDGTPPGSPLRRLIAADIAHHAHDDSQIGDGWMQDMETYSRETLLEALRATVKVRDKKVSTCPGVDSYLEEE